MTSFIKLIIVCCYYLNSIDKFIIIVYNINRKLKNHNIWRVEMVTICGVTIQTKHKISSIEGSVVRFVGGGRINLKTKKVFGLDGKNDVLLIGEYQESDCQVVIKISDSKILGDIKIS